MEKNKSKNNQAEFGIEFGDINAVKFYELAANRSKDEKKEDQKKGKEK